MTTGFDSYRRVGVPRQGRQFADGQPFEIGPPFDLRESFELSRPVDQRPPYKRRQTVGHPRPARHASPDQLDVVEPRYPAAAAAIGVDVVARPAGKPWLSRVGIIVLVAALAGAVGWQTYELERLGDRVDDTELELIRSVAAGRSDVAALESRATELEAAAARVFDPEAISAAVLPSVFRVRAGDFTGTTFAVGDKADDDESNLLTNFHVVESVWEADSRKVFLDRGGVEVAATIVKVDKDNDLALLRVDRNLPALDTATTTVKAGQPVMSAGAPLGLADTITTGVISAFRKDSDAGPTMIQFDAPINPGNSGGPLINSAGLVVGLTTAKARDAEGIGLAIPINTACESFENVC